MTTQFTIDRETAEKVRYWWNEGRGIALWRSIDLNCVADRWLAPSDNGKPSWRAGDPLPLWPNQILVESRVRVPLNPAQFPICKRCNGNGKRSLAELAEIRKETIEQTRERVFSVDNASWGPLSGDVFPCNQCNGTGHVVEYPNVRVTRLPPYKGGGVHFQSAKVDKMAKKLGENVKWDIDYSIGYGLAKAYFYTVTETTLDKIL